MVCISQVLQALKHQSIQELSNHRVGNGVKHSRKYLILIRYSIIVESQAEIRFDGSAS